jgi:uncharacterized membrane protein
MHLVSSISTMVCVCVCVCVCARAKKEYSHCGELTNGEISFTPTFTDSVIYRAFFQDKNERSLRPMVRYRGR